MLPKKHCNIKYETSIASWDEGLPLGNGDMGCLIWGGGNALRLSVDKGDLWDCADAPKAGGDFTYEALQRFVREKKQRKMNQVFDAPYSKPTPTKLPAGKIIIDLQCGNLISELDLASAEATVTGGTTVLKSFVHAEQSVGFLSINRRGCRFTVENPSYGEEKKASFFKRKAAITQSLKNLHYPPAVTGETVKDGIRFLYFTQTVNETLTYGIFLGVTETGEATQAAYTVICAADPQRALEQGFDKISAVMQSGYEQNRTSHAAWWADFWSQSQISLPDPYFEKNWYITNYLLGSCSRAGFSPMPLQGVWTADNGQLPPWKGDYHFDLNAQLSYLSYLKANHLDSGKSYVDFLLKTETAAERFAKDFYGADGLCLPSVMDIQGNPLGGWAMYSLSPANQAWLCHGIKEYWDYTGDLVFLKEKAYPYMKKYGLFLKSLLLRDAGGKLVFPLSSSPETHDNTLKSWLTPNSNYDCAMLHRHFRSLLEMAQALDCEADAAQWQQLLDSIAPLSVDQDQVLMLSPNERQNRTHRHFSHLIAIYPLRLLEYSGADKRVIDCSIADLERLGTKEYCGYSYAWLANLYCVQKNGEKAAQTLEAFWRYFCLPNCFHVNGDYQKTGRGNITYRLFTLEGNFCAADALQEMLLFSNRDTIELFPAVPHKWKDISLRLRASNGVGITCEMIDGKIKKLELQSDRNQTVTVRFQNKSCELQLTDGTADCTHCFA